MTNSISYQRAKEIQQLAGQMLQQEAANPYTDIEEWKAIQRHLATCIGILTEKKGSTLQEEGEMVLAILMGYTIAVRNKRNIALALERGFKVLPLLNDPILKCKLAVFCYGECFDEELAKMAYQLIEEQKQTGNDASLYGTEKLLQNIEENYLVV